MFISKKELSVLRELSSRIDRLSSHWHERAEKQLHLIRALEDKITALAEYLKVRIEDVPGGFVPDKAVAKPINPQDRWPSSLAPTRQKVD